MNVEYMKIMYVNCGVWRIKWRMNELKLPSSSFIQLFWQYWVLGKVILQETAVGYSVTFHFNCLLIVKLIREINIAWLIFSTLEVRTSSVLCLFTVPYFVKKKQNLELKTKWLSVAHNYFSCILTRRWRTVFSLSINFVRKMRRNIRQPQIALWKAVSWQGYRMFRLPISWLL